jgi:hypothetical protein
MSLGEAVSFAEIARASPVRAAVTDKRQTIAMFFIPKAKDVEVKLFI